MSARDPPGVPPASSSPQAPSSMPIAPGGGLPPVMPRAPTGGLPPPPPRAPTGGLPSPSLVHSAASANLTPSHEGSANMDASPINSEDFPLAPAQVTSSQQASSPTLANIDALGREFNLARSAALGEEDVQMGGSSPRHKRSREDAAKVTAPEDQGRAFAALEDPVHQMYEQLPQHWKDELAKVPPEKWKSELQRYYAHQREVARLKKEDDDDGLEEEMLQVTAEDEHDPDI